MAAQLRQRASRRFILSVGVGVGVFVVAAALSGASAAQAADPVPDPAPLAASPTETSIVTDQSLTFGDPVLMTVSVDQADDTPAQGTIELLVGGNGFGTGYPLVDGSVTIALQTTGSGAPQPILLSPGTWSIEADFVPDDPALQAPSSASVDIVIAQGPTTVNLTVSPIDAAFGQEVYVSANVTHYTLVDPTGTFSFYQDGALIGAAALKDFGYGSLRFTPAASGTHTITAVYSGDVDFAGSTSAGTVLTVADAPPTETAGTGTTTGGDATAGGRLAETGVDALSLFVGAGALALLGGAAVTASVTRRRA